MNPADSTNRSMPLQQRMQQHLERLAADNETPITVEGRLTRMVGLTLEAVGFQASVGSRCEIYAPGREPVEAEVVGFHDETLYLMPTSNIRGLVPNARVRPIC
jgi:flagellum-specific ATP synthase